MTDGLVPIRIVRGTGAERELLDAARELYKAQDALTRARARYDQALAAVTAQDREQE